MGKIMKALLALFALTAAAPAFARDSEHLVCTGYMAAQPDPDNYGLAIQFDDGRASDGESRYEVLSSVWAGNLYQGSETNKSGDYPANHAIVLKARTGSAKTSFFRGTYSITEGGKKLVLKGLFNTDPTMPSSKPTAISTTLDCVDISN